MKYSAKTAGPDLAAWYLQPLGQLLWREEQKQASQLLADRWAPIASAHCIPLNLLQVGELVPGELLYLHNQPTTPLKTWVLQADIRKTTHSLYAIPDALPFLDHSMEMILLPHILEFANNPHQVLRETRRVLAPEGHLLIVGFTHYSLWGLAHWLLRHRQQAPWNGHFLSLLRIRDWLELLDFEIITLKYCFYRPPLQSPALLLQLDRFDWIERHLPFMAADYIIIAKKRLWPLTPIRPRWQPAHALFPQPILPEPSTRHPAHQ